MVQGLTNICLDTFLPLAHGPPQSVPYRQVHAEPPAQSLSWLRSVDMATVSEERRRSTAVPIQYERTGICCSDARPALFGTSSFILFRCRIYSLPSISVLRQKGYWCYLVAMPSASLPTLSSKSVSQFFRALGTWYTDCNYRDNFHRIIPEEFHPWFKRVREYKDRFPIIACKLYTGSDEGEFDI